MSLIKNAPLYARPSSETFTTLGSGNQPWSFTPQESLTGSRQQRRFTPQQQHPHYHSGSGFCRSCCHPVNKCCCGSRQCRKESKELLVEPKPKESADDAGNFSDASILPVRDGIDVVKSKESADDADSFSGTSTSPGRDDIASILKESGKWRTLGKGKGNAIIGGGCCVHLSVEYMPADTHKNSPFFISVKVTDSENTVLSWGKDMAVEPGYHIKEGIITTHPGARLKVMVTNAIARVRWCEVFSC